ncbi:FtsW/RodA/SpoVE family cell cycle protein, partial [Tepidiforma sp.]|uniref:FtsW/RodA/SpoVE family cell cycle protein n=1 Tax=Tepidiforma sp. TaxID=2682230 RepID=UPI002ADD51EC
MQRLERDPPLEAQVFRQPHLGHPARSDQTLEAVSSVDDVPCGQRQVNLQVLRSPERSRELLLLASGLAVLLLGWRSLVVAGFELPPAMVRIVTQAAACGLAAHLLVRLLAPRARPEILPMVLLLGALGLVFVVRLAPGSAQDQANWLVVGCVAMAAGILVGRRSGLLRSYTYTAGAAAVVLLVLTGVFGQTINGARLWVRIAGQSVQTTEFIKAFLVLFLAGYLAEAGGAMTAPIVRLQQPRPHRAAVIVPLVLVLAGAIGALALLRDLGSIALILLLSMAMLYVATGQARFVAAGAGLLLVTGIFGYAAFGHVQTRVEAWLDPGADPSGSGYQALQATYAINAGGVLGEGIGRGMPEVVPAASTDYVFTAVAEELGLAGALGVGVLYLAMLASGL